MWTSVIVHFTLYAFYEFLNARWLLRGNVGLDFVKSTPQKDKKIEILLAYLFSDKKRSRVTISRINLKTNFILFWFQWGFLRRTR